MDSEFLRKLHILKHIKIATTKIKKPVILGYFSALQSTGNPLELMLSRTKNKNISLKQTVIVAFIMNIYYKHQA